LKKRKRRGERAEESDREADEGGQGGKRPLLDWTHEETVRRGLVKKGRPDRITIHHPAKTKKHHKRGGEKKKYEKNQVSGRMSKGRQHGRSPGHHKG